MRKVFHIVSLFVVLLLAGCVEPLSVSTGQRIVLQMRCEEAVLTKTEPGLDAYNENLISRVDLFFYSGNIKEPAVINQRAVLHKRFDMAYTTSGSADFTINVSSQEVRSLFPDHVSQITVFALVNYPGDDPLFATEEGTKLDSLYRKTVETVFANPLKTKQDCFMMRGLAVLDLNGVDGREKDVVCTGTVDLARYASKLTVAVHIPGDEGLELNPHEVWHPMRENMEVYLVDGVKTVKLSGRVEGLDEDSYFDYSKDRRRFARRNSQTGEITDLVEPTVVDEKLYYHTYPMYMYPQTWVQGSSDKEGGTCEPYLKLILPWYRDEYDEGGNYVFANQRQCYYKIMMPPGFDKKFEMNTWYHLDLDIEILGALTDESALPVDPCSCFIVPWQNIDHNVEQKVDVGEAHYLFVERDSIVLRNAGELSVPYLTSHPAQIKNASIHATRPYYGTEPKGTVLYNGTATVREAPEGDTYHIYPEGELYLDYVYGQEQTIDPDAVIEVNGVEYAASTIKINNFEFQVVEALSSVIVKHTLNNDYTQKEFDYSPYTIFFTLEHDHEQEHEHESHETGVKISKTVRIEQYPAVYIDRKTNSDAKRIEGGVEKGSTTVWPKSNDTKYSDSKYWGYVFVDGGAYWPANLDPDDPDSPYTYGIAKSTTCRWVPGARQNRRDRGDNKQDMYFKITGKDALASATKEEYQWRTVWYTGGSLDMFRINVTALPEGSPFVIGDPRTYLPRDINAEYKKSFNEKFYQDNGDFKEGTILPEPDPELRDGFAIAPALYGGEHNRTLTWYYPADVTDRTKKMLAPSFRISSKFSGIEFGSISREYATYRCAAYQEDGYPAGRWRLPTMAEITFVSMLAANEVFAELFGWGVDFWCSTGSVRVEKGKVSPSSAKTAYLRCVYDTWYWGDEQLEDRNTFVWGDKER